MTIGIVTDSTCDLPDDLVRQHGLQVVPSVLVIDGREYADGEGISRGEFYTRLPALKSSPTTAASSIGEFSLRYRALLEGGCEQVISVHAASGLTAICHTAGQAAKEFEGRVIVVDSQSLSLGLGFQALAAAEAAEEGLQAALDAIESTRHRLHLFAVLDTLAYVRRSGRIPAALKLFGGLLKVKPMIELSNGAVRTIGALRTTTAANDRMADFFDSGGPFERLAILHTGAEARARDFLRRIMQDSGPSLPRDILMVNVTPVIGVHVGPNGLGFAAVRAAA
jgi:DegV family protein with EDD domain